MESTGFISIRKLHASTMKVEKTIKKLKERFASSVGMCGGNHQFEKVNQLLGEMTKALRISSGKFVIQVSQKLKSSSSSDCFI